MATSGVITVLMEPPDRWDLLAEDDLSHTHYPHETGLWGILIAVIPGGYGPRLRVAVEVARRGPLQATVTISDQPYIEEGALPPAVGRQVFSFIQRNRDILQALWNEAISAAEASRSFRKGLKQP